MKSYLCKALAIAALPLLSGCATLQNYIAESNMSTLTEAPSSSASYDEALARARKLAQGDPNLRLVQVSDTGSMKPFLGENSILVMEPVRNGTLRKGDVASFRDGAAEKAHIVAGFTWDGQVLMRGAKERKTQRVPMSAITGRMTAAFWFDRQTLESPSQGKLPVAYANTNQATAPAGLTILKAQMLTSAGGARMTAAAPGEYNLSLDRGAGIRISVGAPGANWENASSVELRWEEYRSGSTRRVSVYDQANPGLGTILLHVGYN